MRAHHIEFCWLPGHALSLRAHCTDCDEYVDSPALSHNWESIRRAQAKLRAILEERPCHGVPQPVPDRLGIPHPDRRGPIIVGGVGR